MRCKLSENARTNTRAGFLPIRLSGKSLSVVLGFALLASGGTLRAQDVATPKSDGVISGTAYLPGGEPASQVALSLKSHDAGRNS